MQCNAKRSKSKEIKKKQKIYGVNASVKSFVVDNRSRAPGLIGSCPCSKGLANSRVLVFLFHVHAGREGHAALYDARTHARESVWCNLMGPPLFDHLLVKDS